MTDPSGGFTFRFDLLWYPEHSGAACELAYDLGRDEPETPEALADLVALCCKRSLKRVAAIDCAIDIVSITPYPQEQP